MDTCPACGLQTDELPAHTSRAHGTDPLGLERTTRAGRKEHADRLAAQLRQTGLNVVELTPEEGHDIYESYLRAQRDGGYL